MSIFLVRYQPSIIAPPPGDGRDLVEHVLPEVTKSGPAYASRSIDETPLRNSGPSRYAAPDSDSRLLAEEEYVVVSKRTLEERSDICAPTSQWQAQAALADYLRAHPAERGQLQIIALAEIAEVA